MRISYSADDLSEEHACLVLADIIILNVVVKLSSVCEFHDHEDIIGGIKHFIELDNVLMTDEFQDFNFSLDLGDRGSTFEMRFLFFILRLLIILIATFTPVRSCLASESVRVYLSLLRILQCQQFFLRYNVRCEPIPCVRSNNYKSVQKYDSISPENRDQIGSTWRAYLCGRLLNALMEGKCGRRRGALRNKND